MVRGQARLHTLVVQLDCFSVNTVCFIKVPETKSVFYVCGWMWDVINILHKHSEQCLHHMHHDYSTKE